MEMGCGIKFGKFCFALLLPQILDNFQNQGQFWKGSTIIWNQDVEPLY